MALWSKICSKIGLEIERSDTLFDRVCHACAWKIRNAFELYNFIYSSLQKEKVVKVSSEVAYRISAVLFHRGIKHKDL